MRHSSVRIGRHAGKLPSALLSAVDHRKAYHSLPVCEPSECGVVLPVEPDKALLYDNSLRFRQQWQRVVLPAGSPRTPHLVCQAFPRSRLSYGLRLPYERA